MIKNYADAEEKWVKTVTAYADADDGNLFYDAAKSEGIDKDTVKNLFVKGLLVINLSGELLRPVALKDNSTHVTVTAVKDSGTAATMLNFNSIEEAG